MVPGAAKGSGQVEDRGYDFFGLGVHHAVALRVHVVFDHVYDDKSVTAHRSLLSELSGPLIVSS
jgi:hypothetical protein